MKKKLGIMLSTSVFTFSGFGMELQQDVSSTKSSTVTVQTAMTKDMEDKSAEQIAEIQKLLETQIQAAQVEVDFVNSTIKYCKPCFSVSKISFSSIIDIGTKHTKLFEEEAINLTLTE